MHRDNGLWPGTILGAVLICGACSEISAPHSPVAEIRLFSAETDVTNAVSVSAFYPVELEARFYDAAGNQINLSRREHSVEMFSTPGLLNVLPDPDDRFRARLRVSGPCVQGDRSLRVGFGHWERGDERVFSFPMEVEDPVKAVRFLDISGVETTPSLRLNATRPTIVEVRFDDCEDRTLPFTPQEVHVDFKWSDPELFTVRSTAGGNLRYEINANASARTDVEVVIDLRRTGLPEAQRFGPYPVIIQ